MKICSCATISKFVFLKAAFILTRIMTYVVLLKCYDLCEYFVVSALRLLLGILQPEMWALGSFF